MLYTVSHVFTSFESEWVYFFFVFWVSNAKHNHSFINTIFFTCFCSGCIFSFCKSCSQSPTNKICEQKVETDARRETGRLDLVRCWWRIEIKSRQLKTERQAVARECKGKCLIKWSDLHNTAHYQSLLTTLESAWTKFFCRCLKVVALIVARGPRQRRWWSRDQN